MSVPSIARRRGAAGQQYAIVVGLVGIVALLAVTSVGSGIGTLFTGISNRLTNVNGGGSGTGDAGAGGAAATPPAGTLVADYSADFGTVGTGSSVTRSFTYTVAAGAPATAVRAQVTGSGLTLSGNSCGTAGSPLASLAAGAACVFTVAWAPSSAGTLAGSSVAVVTAGGASSVDLAGTAAVLTGSCVTDGGGQRWCVGGSGAATGITTCGHAAGYAGTYYAATTAAAAALGRSLNPTADCATNHATALSGGTLNGTGLSCWTNAQRWARTGSDNGGYVAVRCVNMEAAGIGFGPVTNSDFGYVVGAGAVSRDFVLSGNGGASATGVSVSVTGTGISILSNGCTATLAAGASCTVSVGWSGANYGTLSGATVKVVSSAGTRTVALSGARGLLPANCVRDTNSQVWCLGPDVAATGASTCGYASNYSGTYYAATTAAATALGKTLSANADCATNYLGSNASVIMGSSLSCWTNAQRWARTGTGAIGTPVFVRCTNLE